VLWFRDGVAPARLRSANWDLYSNVGDSDWILDAAAAGRMASSNSAGVVLLQIIYLDLLVFIFESNILYHLSTSELMVVSHDHFMVFLIWLLSYGSTKDL
jgi:hypothetical protein